MRRSTPTIVAVAFALAAGLSGCSQGSGRDAIAVRAVAATEAARTFRVVGESKAWDPSDPEHPRLSSHSEGDVDLARQSLHATWKSSSDDSSWGQAGEDTFEIIRIGPEVWTRFSPSDVNYLGGPITTVGFDRWRHSTRRSDLPGEDQDPSTMLDRLRAGGARLTQQGHDTIRGVSTTHYRADGGDSTSTSSKNLAIKSSTTDVWIDSDDIVRRMTTAYEVETSGDDHSLQRSENIVDFYDFGVALNIEPPPPALVDEASDAPEEATTTTWRPRHLGNDLLTFEPVRTTSAPPCRPPALPMSDKSECLTVGEVRWEPPVLDSVDATVGMTGQWAVEIVLTETAIRQFNEIAGACYVKAASCSTGRIAVVLNNTVLSAPEVQAASFEGPIMISGNFSERDAKDLAGRIT